MLIKILFIDIDGMLNTAYYRATADNYYHSIIDKEKMPLLKEIVDKTGAKLVLTSEWRID